MLKLYGFTSSTCTRLVALVCKEKDIPYELISVNLAKGEQKNPAFMANQPFGQVPYIVSPTLSNLSLSYLRDIEGRRWFHSIRVSRDCEISVQETRRPRHGVDPHRSSGRGPLRASIFDRGVQLCRPRRAHLF